jgi:phosphatidylglycerophosphate synthase
LLRISPNVLTMLGLVAAAATALTATSWWAVLFLVFSLFCDGIDGSVAIFQKRQSAWGATLDSVVDRVSEALWLYALYVIGVPAWLVITLWSVASFQEYARAKLVSLGVADIGVVTPSACIVPVRCFDYVAVKSARNIYTFTCLLDTSDQWLFNGCPLCALPIALATISALNPTKGNPPPG